MVSGEHGDARGATGRHGESNGHKAMGEQTSGRSVRAC